MKVYKLEVIIIDFDNIGEKEIKDVLENANFPNDCISPIVNEVEAVDIGEWYDDHPLNKKATFKRAVYELFDM